ncbi:MAG: SDR family oxidoreductase, partial [Acidobacteriota bacterium]
MICVTGAGGTVGRELVRQLEAAGTDFRSAYFSIGKVESARGRGLDAVLIDYSDPETLRTAFENCDKLFLLGPSVPHQVELEINAVGAAQATGVKHIVKLSVMDADKEDYEFGRIHREVEKAIEASGLDWTFLRPNSFMQNGVTYMSDSIRTQSTIYSSAGDGKISCVDVRDIAAVGFTALTEPGHEKKVYTLNGPEAFSYDEMATRFSDVLGRTISHVNLPPADLKGA